MVHAGIAVFAVGSTQKFGRDVAAELQLPLAAHEEREFEDGEHKIRPLESVRDKDVFVIHSLYGDPGHSVNDKLVRLLFFVGALRDASAARVTAVVPYLAYARKDARTQPRDPVTTRYVAALFEAVGTDRVVALDVHNPAAFENAFRCRTEHLTATPILARHFAAQASAGGMLAVVSPDPGGVKRAERLRATLAGALGVEPTAAFLDKGRGKGILRGGRLVGDVADRQAVIVDDIVSTGGTLAHAARACREAGAAGVWAAATHGLFTGAAAETLGGGEIDRLIVTDTVPPWRLPAEFVARKLTVLSVAPLVAEAIRRLHGGGSLVELLQS
jgi:ribose-phosphate pyrophosphokinase